MTPRIRKLVTTRELTFQEMGTAASRPIARAVGGAWHRQSPNSLGLDDVQGGRCRASTDPALRLLIVLVPSLRRQRRHVGLARVRWSTAAPHLSGPMLGKPMRAALGGGKALIPSAVQGCSRRKPLRFSLGAPPQGQSATVVRSIRHAWADRRQFSSVPARRRPCSRAHSCQNRRDSIADAPREDEIVVAMAIADGGRLWPRCGDAPIT